MLKKIILPVILLIFTQQDFYGARKVESEYPSKLEVNRSYVGEEEENRDKHGMDDFYGMEQNLYVTRQVESEYPSKWEIDLDHMRNEQLAYPYGGGNRGFYDMEKKVEDEYQPEYEINHKKEEYSDQKVIDDFSGPEIKRRDSGADNIAPFKAVQNNREWGGINDWVNVDFSGSNKKYPKLWLLWTIFDNIHFQYGGSKIWKHGEAYYGLSNGIGFFPSFLNFGWLKIGIIDAHINVINLILDFIKNYIQRKNESNDSIGDLLLFPIIMNPCFNFHIFSVKILNCIKIKLVAPLTLLPFFEAFISERENGIGKAWYITYNTDKQISWWYGLLSPRIEINIPGIIDLF